MEKENDDDRRRAHVGPRSARGQKGNSHLPDGKRKAMQLQSRPLAATIRQMRSGSRMAKETGCAALGCALAAFGCALVWTWATG